jgi:predicted  nucleic acid-binding Zn-ribbon protein
MEAPLDVLQQEIGEIEEKLDKMINEVDIVQSEYSNIKTDCMKLKREILDREITLQGLSKAIKTSKHNIERSRMELESKKRAYFKLYKGI